MEQMSTIQERTLSGSKARPTVAVGKDRMRLSRFWDVVAQRPSGGAVPGIQQ